MKARGRRTQERAAQRRALKQQRQGRGTMPIPAAIRQITAQTREAQA